MKLLAVDCLCERVPVALNEALKLGPAGRVREGSAQYVDLFDVFAHGAHNLLEFGGGGGSLVSEGGADGACASGWYGASAALGC